MKHNRIRLTTRLLFAGIPVLLTNCDPCRNLDCLPRFDRFSFLYQSPQGEDLLSGTAKKYELEDLKFYSFDINNNKINASLSIDSNEPSVVKVSLEYNTVRSFLEIKGAATDTIDFKFNIEETKCCGTVSTIEETKVNGIGYPNNSPVVIVERK